MVLRLGLTGARLTRGFSLLVMSVFVLVIAVLLRILGFERTFRWTRRLTGTLGEPASEKPFHREKLLRLKRLTRLIKRKGIYRGNCLSRSIMLWILLRRQGICCELRFGSRIRDGEFQAHAWVEHNGIPVNASPRVNSNYTVFEFDSADSLRSQIG